MPIFEYRCKSCGKQFEALIRGSKNEIQCECGSRDTEKLFSTFAVSESNSMGSHPTCSNGTCDLPSSPCASGLCSI